MDQKFVSVSVEERLIEWRKLEQAASEAEHAVKALGQAAADPRVGELLSNAKFLRQKADREFAAIVRCIKLDEPTSERRSTDSNDGSAHPH